MLLEDKGKPNKYPTTRLNYDVVIDNERFTLQKLSRNLGFYSVIFDGKIKEVETVYDTDKKLLTSAGLILRKKNTPERSYFSLVRIVSLADLHDRERKSFLGECEPNDRPSDFPVQIADEINQIFNNLFTINLVDVVKHSTPYILMSITGNRYKIICGTGYEMEASFENLNIKDVRTGRKARRRIFSLWFENIPKYEKEKQEVLDTIDRHCKELVLMERNRFEIAEVAINPPIKQTDDKGGKSKKDKKNKKQNEEA